MNVAKTHHIQRLSFVIMLLFVLVSSSKLSQLWFINKWSVDFTKHSMIQSEYNQSWPRTHRRAPIWMANIALKNNNLERSLHFLEPPLSDNDPLAYRVAGQVFVQLGDITQAISLWSNFRDYVAIIDFAETSEQAGRTDESLLGYQAAQMINPGRGTYLLTESFYKKNDIESAVQVLERAILDYPESPYRIHWLYRLAEIYMEQNQWQEATEVYYRIQTDYPNDMFSLIQLGWIAYSASANAEEALDIFSQVIVLWPNDGNGYYATAVLLSREQRYYEAEEWFLQAIERSPKNRAWYLTRANSLRRAGQVDLAIRYYKETIEIFPEYVDVYYELAWAFRVQGSKRESLSILDESISTMDQPESFYLLQAGRIYEWADEREKALESYRSVLTLDPSNVIAQESVSRLLSVSQ